MYLVDTNVISAAAPAKVAIKDSIIDWMDRNAGALFLSVVTVAEIADGVAKARREGANRKADAFAGWLDVVVRLYGDRIIPMDIAIARRAGEISDRVRGIGHDPGLGDLIIGATADCHGLVVLTRNTRHFAPMGIAMHDPFASLPSS